ncbi:MAG TPA: PstS family phosphate ABC transporter substrate-binding protein [Bacteroidales bacterium]|nr:PstS family phosphate ABC transporter substrate-binding protein [Bacteroidales bacterium]HSA43263.1 PstS family phosphate ABC transporter substrate-binding protein [Bacteroidales bacterium]
MKKKLVGWFWRLPEVLRVAYRSFPLLVILLVLLLSCRFGRKGSGEGSQAEEGEISISGAFALYPLAVRWAEAYMKLCPEVRIDISAGGAGKGITDVLNDMVEIGMVSRNMNPGEISSGAFAIAVARDAVLPTISAYNRQLNLIRRKGMSRETFRKLYLEDSFISWGSLTGSSSHKKVMVYTRSDACGAAETWAEFLGTNQESLYGVGVFGDPGIADAVKSDEYGIGYNNLIYIYDLGNRLKYNGLDVIPLDFNANGIIDPEEDFYETIDQFLAAVEAGRFPSPPARDLYFVTNGRPDDPVLTGFLKWILTEGQHLVHESGYIPLNHEEIENELNKLR